MEIRVLSLLLSLSIFIWPKPPSALAANPSGNETDRLALLDFKHRITHDPSGLLTSWNGTTHYCEWEGVRCSGAHPLRVVAMDLSSRGLSGTLPPSLANLTFLRGFLLPDNQFSGGIPPELGRLRRLRNLNLTSNSLGGGIPPNLSHCSSLRWLDLRSNPLVGTIPVELGSLASLDTLLLDGNNITGAIPPSLGNVSTLTRLMLSDNGLAGGVPEELGKLAGLRFLQLSVNILSGTVPSPLYNISSLTTFGLASNRLHGSLPATIGITLPNLRYLYFGGNQFSGALPASLSNASRLLDIDFYQNNFSGRVPSDLGRLQRGFYYLNLGWNQLEASDAGGWEFLDSLTNCTQLQLLNLNGNSLEGGLPRSVGNLSTQLQVLYFGSNRISGSIPPGIQNLGNLYSLGLYNNHLTGEIPGGIGRLAKLQVLSLDRNNLTGPVPSSIGNLTQLIKLYLFANSLHGPIPASLGELQHLSDLDLYGNRLNGSIPREIFALPFLSFFIDLSSNSLVGTLPSEVGSLTNLRQFDVYGNKLSGEIPASLGNCKVLEVLLMGENSFHGAIPPSLGSIKGLRSLDLSQNNLSGPIPAILESLPFLENLDLSFNRLEGEVPMEGVFGNSTAISLAGNDGLCGGIRQLHLPPCPPKKTPGNRRRSGLLIAVILVASAVLCSIALISVIFINRRRKSRKRAPPLPSPDEHYPKVSYHELAKATDGFSNANLLGSGRYGSVYKGSLDHDETTVAVKVFNLQQSGASKSFITECEALRRIRHRNLVKILTSCVSVDHKGSDFKALVFEFMPNGSLEAWLHPRGEEQSFPGPLLGLCRRLDAAIDIADALEYLHHGCQTPVVHCDLKPSNILLDDRMTARVGDFGLAKLLSDAMIEPQDSFSLAGIRGSIGYVAPEYGAGRQVSISGDVYSYGILLLEMFTGKRPVDDAFKDGLNLRKFVETAFPERITEIIDPSLLSSRDDEDVLGGRRVEESLMSVVRVGLSCSKELPGERMSMRDAATELHAIRDAYNGAWG